MQKGPEIMAFSYNPLWKTLIDKGMTKKELREQTHISSATMTRLNKGQFVNLEALDKICQTLQCRIEHIVEYTPDK